MRSIAYISLSLLIFLTGCKNIDDATPSDMSSFMKFFHGPYNYRGVQLEITPDGYSILGNMLVRDDSVVAFILKTDKQGHQIEDTHYFPGKTAKAFKALYSGDQLSGYMVVCDSIKINPGANRVGDIEIYSSHLFKADAKGNIMKILRFTDASTDTSKAKIDFKSISVTTNETQIITLCTYKEDLSKSEKPFLIAFDFDLNPKWNQKYDLIDHNYINGKSINYSDGSLIWATSILKPSGDFNDSYLAIPNVEENNTFKNFDQLGEGTSQLLLAKEMQPASIPAAGFGVIGQYAMTSGEKSNLFFIRVDKQGNLIRSSELYFDYALSQAGTPVNSSESESQDSGESLTATSDGGFCLAGTTQQGSNLKDIYVIKLNALNEVVWSKTFGGVGDETPTCIREDNEGNLLMIGTNNLAGLSSLFLVKMDKVGGLKH